MKLLGDAGRGRDPDSYCAAAELLGYCVLGPEGFHHHNPPGLAGSVERRLAAALELGDSLVARLILLTLHAKIIRPSLVEHYGLEAE